MKLCGYCGRENDQHSMFCRECGTPLARSQDEADLNALPRPERRLNAAYATLILLIYVCVQIGVSMVVGDIAISIKGNQQADLKCSVPRFFRELSSNHFR